MLFGVGVLDGPTYAVVAAALVLMVCGMPALGASCLDPLAAIRGE